MISPQIEETTSTRRRSGGETVPRREMLCRARASAPSPSATPEAGEPGGGDGGARPARRGEEFHDSSEAAGPSS